jgi:hypothetical protein
MRGCRTWCGWLGELERHLGGGVIEAAVGEAIAAGRLKPRQRRRIMPYPLVIRLMLAMALMPDALAQVLLAGGPAVRRRLLRADAHVQERKTLMVGYGGVSVGIG